MFSGDGSSPTIFRVVRCGQDGSAIARNSLYMSCAMLCNQVRDAPPSHSHETKCKDVGVMGELIRCSVGAAQRRATKECSLRNC